MSIWYPGYGISFSKYLFLETKVGRDLAGPLQKGVDRVASKISEQTLAVVANNNQLEKTLKNGFNSVTNAINWGMNRIDNGIQNLNNSLESLRADFDYKTTLIIEQLYINNYLLVNITDKLDAINEKLENPSLTESRESFKKGMRSFLNGFYKAALDNFVEAEKKNNIDIFTQYFMGLLYLFGVNEDEDIVDLDQAKKHFIYAARYAKAEINVDKSFINLATNAYFYASIAVYAQLGEFSNTENLKRYKELLLEAFQLMQNATLLNPNLIEAFYHLAKYSALLDDSSAAIEYLEKTIFMDRNYAIKVDIDPAFDKIREDTITFLKNMKEKRKAQCTVFSNEANRLFSEANMWHMDKYYLSEFNISLANDFFESDTLFGYIDAESLYKVTIDTLPYVITKRKDSILNDFLMTKAKTLEILNNAPFFNFLHINELIKETKAQIQSATSKIKGEISYDTYMDALIEIKQALSVANEINNKIKNQKFIK